jgi:hypothetical protein
MDIYRRMPVPIHVNEIRKGANCTFKEDCCAVKPLYCREKHACKLRGCIACWDCRFLVGWLWCERCCLKVFV